MCIRERQIIRWQMNLNDFQEIKSQDQFLTEITIFFYEAHLHSKNSRRSCVNSYHNLDFTAATQIIRWQMNLNDFQEKKSQDQFLTDINIFLIEEYLYLSLIHI